MIVPQMNQNIDYSQSEGRILSTHNDDPSINKNDNKIFLYLSNNNFDVSNAESVTNQNNSATANDNNDMSEANQTSLSLNFDQKLADIES